MEALVRDVRLAVRVLARRPGFTAAAVLCLGLGIGATSAVWSVVQAVLLRALPYAEPERLVAVWGRGEKGSERLPVSVPEFLDLRAQRGVFAEVSLLVGSFLNLTGDGEPERMATGRVSANFFSLLGVPTQLGRTFEPQEGTAGTHRVAVLSAGLWRRRFGADRGILGRSLTLGDEPFTVVGVLPDGFRYQRFSDEPDLWTPIVLDPAKSPPRDARIFGCMARLAPGVTLERARAEMAVLARRFRTDYPQLYPDKEWRIELNPLHEVTVMDVRTFLLVLFAAVVLLLLIACSNVANLLLARAAARGKEVALRTAIGASRGSLVRQFLAEALVLATCGGALGLAIAWWSTRILVVLNPEKLPRVGEIGLDGASVAFTAALVLATAVLVGLLPALRASRAPLNDVLKEGGKTSGMGSRRQRLRGALVVVEIALAVVVLVGAGLVARSLARLAGEDPGFRTRGILTFEVFTTVARYPQDPQRAALADQLLERLRALPGVERAALINGLPLASTGLLLERVAENRPPAPGTSPPLADWRIASPGYFEALGIPLVEGRTFTVRDQAGGVEAAVVDESLARREWPGESALGKRLKLNRPDG
ncbi:MAG TPA: ADOP family duplicated permease, partial [Thermoanaerobaculia bacterium]|nr:ADOP family duplicated permease [Thermoanaerobaculia bacterium]